MYASMACASLYEWLADITGEESLLDKFVPSGIEVKAVQELKALGSPPRECYYTCAALVNALTGNKESSWGVC